MQIFQLTHVNYVLEVVFYALVARSLNVLNVKKIQIQTFHIIKWSNIWLVRIVVLKVNINIRRIILVLRVIKLVLNVIQDLLIVNNVKTLLVSFIINLIILAIKFVRMECTEILIIIIVKIAFKDVNYVHLQAICLVHHVRQVFIQI